MNAAGLIASLGLEKLSPTGIAVVAALVLLSVWSLTISAERLIAFRRARRQSIAYAKVLAKRPEREHQNWLREAVEASSRFPHSHLARVVSAGLITYQQKRARGTLAAEAVVEAAGRAVERSSMVTLAGLRRGIGSLATIATISPFVGLFGTVVGIIHAFRAIADSGGAAASRPSRRGSRKLWSPPLSVSWSRFRRPGCSTTSPSASSGSGSRWRAPRPS